MPATHFLKKWYQFQKEVCVKQTFPTQEKHGTKSIAISQNKNWYAIKEQEFFSHITSTVFMSWQKGTNWVFPWLALNFIDSVDSTESGEN